MRIIKPSVELSWDLAPDEILRKIEKVGRTCYKSEDKITTDSAAKFVKKIVELGHEAVIEHATITARIICDRGVTHEIVRHRIASYAQESTRYCNYSKDKFSNELTYIKPIFYEENSKEYKIWEETMERAEENYLKLIDMGSTPQEARSLLPNSLKTEIVVTMNLREWRHFIKLRCAKAAHPQMREVANMIRKELTDKLPEVFSDIKLKGE